MFLQVGAYGLGRSDDQPVVAYPAVADADGDGVPIPEDEQKDLSAQ